MERKAEKENDYDQYDWLRLGIDGFQKPYKCLCMHTVLIGKTEIKKDLKTIDSCKKESGSSVSSDGDELFAVLSERGLEM